MSKEWISPRIQDHCFVPDHKNPENDKCQYDNCRAPELLHEWTVGANAPNKPFASA